MEIDLPEVLAEVGEAFARYEAALVGNDVATLDALHAFFGEERYRVAPALRSREAESHAGSGSA